jgi:hypothetical protein
VATKKNTRLSHLHEENPRWLDEDPKGGSPPPPVNARAASLPFDRLEWRDFERLCKRLAERDGTVDQVWAYGTQGQSQYGIDVLVRLADGTFEVWQTKRYRKFTPSNLRSAIKIFAKHKWASQARRFVLAVSSDLSDQKVVDAIETGRDQLAAMGVTFRALDQTQLTELLRREPYVVDDFFGRPWVLAVCPPEAIDLLSSRISRFDRSNLRAALLEAYSTWISTVDPGLPIAGLDRLGRTSPAVPLAQRYVKPDVVLRAVDFASVQSSTATTEAPASEGDSGESARPGRQRQGGPVVREQRIAVDRLLGESRRVLVAGDAGIGKSTLLRMLALDVLSDAPQFDSIRERYADYLPVWVSFPLWARMAAGRTTPPAIEDAVSEFLVAQSRPELAAELRKALADGRKILMLVDGVDEAADPAAAQTIAALLVAVIESRAMSCVVTSRPHGLRTMGAFSSAWTRVELAALSSTQKHALAKVWFRVLEQLEGGVASTDDRIDGRADRRATTFISALQRNTALARLSETPLFLLALMELHRHGHRLPRSRFAAVEKIIEQLVEHQPQRRATDSLLTVAPTSNARLRDRLLADLAFALHAGEMSGAVTDAAIEDSAVERASKLVMERQGSGDQEGAEAFARSAFVFAEERAGLLVKRAPRNIGFLHLSIQECLAARHLLQWPLPDRIAFIGAHAAHQRWHEPILYLLHLVQTESEVGQLVRAIENATAADRNAVQARDSLLTEAIFADLPHDGVVARDIARRLLLEAEASAGVRQRHLLTSVVNGLSSETVGVLCREKVAEWIPNRHAYARSRVLPLLVRFPSSLRGRCTRVALRCLSADEEVTREAAGQALISLSDEEFDAKRELLAALRSASSVEMIAAALSALRRGWVLDPQVGAIAAATRSAPEDSIALEAIRIRALRSETDEADFTRFLTLTYPARGLSDKFENVDLVEHFARVRRAEYSDWLRAALKNTFDRNPHRIKPLMGSLLICDPEAEEIERGMFDLLKNDWMIRSIFERSAFPVEKIPWTPRLVAELERHVEALGAHSDYELYWISKAIRLDGVKKLLIDHLAAPHELGFWSAEALVEVWGPDDPDVRAAILRVADGGAPNEIAAVSSVLPQVLLDRDKCRSVLLQALRGHARRVHPVIDSLRTLGISSEDDEAFQAAWEVLTNSSAPLYQDQARASIIRAFARRVDVRELAMQEIQCRGGAIDAVAESYSRDVEMTSAILRVVGSLPETEREVLFSAVRTAAATDDYALDTLATARQDSAALIHSEATIAQVEALVARDKLDASHVAKLVADLDAVGPHYEQTRLAAVIGLLISGNIDRFASATERDKPLSVSVARVSLRDDGRDLRRLLAEWDELVQALGGEEQVLERFELTPESVLSLLEPTWPNAQRLFELMMLRSVGAPHLSQHVLLSATARFEPGGQRTRQLVQSTLMSDEPQYWAMLIAGEIFAEQFAGDQDFRNRLIERFSHEPRGAATGALAELLLRHRDDQTASLLRSRSQGVGYDIATHFKLVAAISKPENVGRALEGALSEKFEDIHSWHFPRWVPAVMRRIEMDSEVQAVLHSLLKKSTSPSVKVSIASLLGKAAGVEDRLVAFASDELRRSETLAAPEVGLDMYSQAYRIVPHVLMELAG